MLDYGVFLENEEQLYAYFSKEDTTSCQIYPIPEDLSLWYRVAISSESEPRNKQYDVASGTLVPLLPTREVQQQKRTEAYAKESDPLFMEWQFDQTEEALALWRDKVKEIKERYPLP